MTEGTEQVLEYVASGVLFCMAIAMLLWIHGAFLKQVEEIGNVPDRVILYEQKG